MILDTYVRAWNDVCGHAEYRPIIRKDSRAWGGQSTCVCIKKAPKMGA